MSALLDEVFSRFPQIETDRLRLREAHRADAEAVFAVLSQEEVCRYYSLSPLASVNEAQTLIERRRSAFGCRERIRWAIAQSDDDVVIGSCGYVHWHPGNSQAEIGYELAPAAQGKGLMREALSAILGFGFTRMLLWRVEAFVVPENAPSLRLLEQLGFIDEGLQREHGFWKGQSHDQRLLSLCRKDWNG